MIDIKTPHLIVIGAVVILLLIALLWMAASFYYRENLLQRRQKRRQIRALKKHHLAASGHKFLSAKEKRQIKAIVRTGDLMPANRNGKMRPVDTEQTDKQKPASNLKMTSEPEQTLSSLNPDCRREVEASMQVILEASALLSKSELHTEQIKLVNDIIDQAHHARAIISQCPPPR